jgi:hypothetical protein
MIEISYSVSDNDILPSGKNNLFVNPQFRNPNLFDFRLAASSACLGAATDGNMGANLVSEKKFNQLFISSIAFKSNLISDVNEFIELTNSGNSNIAISGFEFTKGITFRFPENSKISAGEKVYIAYNSESDFWLNSGLAVYQWETGRLADEGEAIRFQNPQGIVVDQVFFNHDVTWPDVSPSEGISLIADNLDNHFGENWKAAKLNAIVNVTEELASDSDLKFYPNPTNGILNISGLKMEETLLNIYNLSGVLVKSGVINSNHSQINLNSLEQGIYIIRCSNSAHRVILLK